jgi:hypothetical protein
MNNSYTEIFSVVTGMKLIQILGEDRTEGIASAPTVVYKDST